MRDVGKAPQRATMYRPFTQKQRPTFHMNTSQIVRFADVLDNQNKNKNNQLVPGCALSPGLQKPTEEQNLNSNNHFSTSENVGSSLGSKNFHQSLPPSKKLSITEMLQSDFCQLTLSQKMSLMQKCGLSNNPMKNSIFPLPDESSQLKLVKVGRKNAEYEKLNIYIQNCDQRRTAVMKYLDQQHKGWVKQMSQDEINILYDQIAKQLNHVFQKQVKHRQMEKQRQILLKKKRKKQLQRLQKQRQYNQFIEKAQAKIKQNKIKNINQKSSFEKQSLTHHKSIKSEIIVIDSDSQEPTQNPKPCNSWIFQNNALKQRQHTKNMELNIAGSSIKQESKQLPFVVCCQEYQEYSYAEVEDLDTTRSKNSELRKSRNMQQTIDSYKAPTPIKKMHKEIDKSRNEEKTTNKSSQIMNCIQNMVVLIEKFDPDLRRK